jgi:hypothetical protein
VSATDPPNAALQASDLALHRTIEAVWRIESVRVIAGRAVRLGSSGFRFEVSVVVNS